MADFRIRVIVDPTQATRGTRQVQRDLTGLERSSERLRGFLVRAFTIGAVLELSRQVITLADTYNRLQNQLRVVTDSTEELNTVTDRLFDISQQTRTSFEGNIQLYQRLRIATDELGASQEELFLFTERVGQALSVFGISSEQARGALLQLSQGLQSGIFRAEEFNSILEGAFPIVQAAARGIEGLDGSVGALRQRVLDGNLTSREFFEGFLAGSEEIEEQFRQTSVTIGQGFTLVGNSALGFVGRLEETVDAAGGAGQALQQLSEIIDALSTRFFPAASDRLQQIDEELQAIRDNPVVDFFRELAEAVGLNSDALVNSSVLNQRENDLLEERTRLNNNLLAQLRQQERQQQEINDLTIESADIFAGASDEVRQLADDLRFELEQLGRNSEAQRAAALIRDAGIEQNSRAAQGIRDLVAQIEDETRAIEVRNDELERATRLAEEEQRAREDALRRGESVLAQDRADLEQLVEALDPATAAADRLNQQLALLGRAEILDPSLTEERVAMLREELERLNRLEVLDEQTDLASGFERGLLRVGERVNDFASSAESIIGEAFQGATDAFQDFVRTGELDLQNFARSIADTFLELGTQQLFAGLFGGGGLNLFGGGGGGLGGAGGIGSILGATFGAGGLLGGFGGLAGFQSGAEGVPVNNLSVGRLGGIDNRLVAFRARSDETIDVNRRGESGRPVNVTMNIQTPDADSFRRAQGDILLRTQSALQRSMERSSG
jgi:lambda family phage tail tape measure protein